MSISERINPDHLNIHQFQETPEANNHERIFDPEKYITPEHKEKIIQNYRESYDDMDFSDIFDFALAIKALWPEENIPLPAIDIALTQLVDRGRSRISIWTTMKSLYPNFEYDISEQEAAIGELKTEFKTWIPTYKAEALAQTKMLNTGFKAKIEPTEIAFIQNKMQEHWSQGHTGDVLFLMHHLRLADESYQPHLSLEQWSLVMKDLEEFSIDGDFHTYALFAWCLKIITAYKIKFIAPGKLEFEMYPPEDVNTSTPPIPEKRKF